MTTRITHQGLTAFFVALVGAVLLFSTAPLSAQDYDNMSVRELEAAASDFEELLAEVELGLEENEALAEENKTEAFDLSINLGSLENEYDILDQETVELDTEITAHNSECTGTTSDEARATSCNSRAGHLNAQKSDLDDRWNTYEDRRTVHNDRADDLGAKEGLREYALEQFVKKGEEFAQTLSLIQLKIAEKRSEVCRALISSNLECAHQCLQSVFDGASLPPCVQGN